MTTAFVEGLKSLFSASKRKARRYCSTEYQVAMLYLVPGKVPKVRRGFDLERSGKPACQSGCKPQRSWPSYQISIGSLAAKARGNLSHAELKNRSNWVVVRPGLS